ncbi:nicotinamide riboside transporter PnuC [Flavobacterium piscinae]|uniref:Nicotinamide riboside transporter PnuC n=1 Tax=Flavobacterium piscinae TaxID=2506424 RepID=A0A4Q1KVB2_9FLAO|nr:nicotinamide riboside transporter PnuC [Flavobacterium piscinae]RXR34102.1 nicotinamide riboside transporter PnuC [Flavobacterium piscinae]
MIEFLFSQYKNYSYTDISLEIIAVIFGLLSVLYSKKNNVLVFPTGIISTGIFIYLLWKWKLIGDMTINFYYTIMSVYGWYHWTRKKQGKIEFPISWMNQKEKRWAVLLFVLTITFIIIIYKFFDKFTSWTAYVDTFTTGLFFVGMWLMAKRKIENWIFWIIGDIISIPLYFYKGYTFTGIQYFIFTIIAFYGYIEWKKILNSNPQAL